MENKTGMQAYSMSGVTWIQTSLPGLMNVTFALLVPAFGSSTSKWLVNAKLLGWQNSLRKL
jgi:hypothetical protein